MDGNYDKILDKIAKSAGIERSEVERKIEAKRAKLSGLISLEGASQIVAAELGISFENEQLKIDELLPGMRKVHTIGKIISLFPIRTFTTKSGDESKVCNFMLADDTSNMKVVLWDTNHIALIENGDIKEGSSVEIISGSMRDNEIHLGSFSEFKKSDVVFENVITEKVVKEKEIKNFIVGESVRVRAFVVAAYEPKFFYVCPECKKKAIPEGELFKCAEHGVVIADKRALMNIVIDDGTETMRSVMFHERLEELGITDLENPENLVLQRNNVLGKELNFNGTIKMNNFFHTPEFVIEAIEQVNLDNLIQKLEK